MNDDFRLDGKTILVTGASGGIGRGICEVLLAAGARVVAQYGTSHDGLSELDVGPDQLFVVQADLSDPSGPAALFEKAEDGAGPIAGLVNNAGLQPVQEFTDTSATDWDKIQAVNVRAAFLLIQALADKGRGGSVVNIGSIEGLQPAPGHTHYAVSKAGIHMLSKAAALECGRGGVRVNTVAPGLIHRDGIEEGWPEGVARWTSRAPLKRLGRPADIGLAVRFLLSDAASWVTGAELTVDGGMNACSTW